MSAARLKKWAKSCGKHWSKLSSMTPCHCEGLYSLTTTGKGHCWVQTFPVVSVGSWRKLLCTGVRWANLGDVHQDLALANRKTCVLTLLLHKA